MERISLSSPGSFRRRSTMATTKMSERVQSIVAGWLSGAETVSGKANPAGSLFIGGGATVKALTEVSELHYTGHCSSCSASAHTACC
jgi:hypothetical protein